MRFLFVTEKYVVGYGSTTHPEFVKYGLTNNIVNLIGSFKSSEIGEMTHYYISTDPGDIWSIEALDNILLKEKFDIAIVSPICGISPSLEVAKILGKKLVICWWDTLFPGPNAEYRIYSPEEVWDNSISRNYDQFKHTMIEYSQSCINIVFDYGNGQERKNIWCLTVPQDTKIYKYTESKNIDFSFIGVIRQQTSIPDRGLYISMIRDAGIDIVVNGGRGPEHGNLPFNEYADMMSRTKICLNVQMGFRVPQRKGRVWEIAAVGGFLFTNYPETFSGIEGNLLEEGTHYISWNDSNLIEKIKYWKDRDEDIKKISRNLYEIFLEKYSPKPWWSKLITICEQN